jgi:hypothetical protein
MTDRAWAHASRHRLVLGEILGIPGEPLAERPPVDAEALRGLFLADVPLAGLEELDDRDLPVLGDRAQHDTERGARLALAVTGVHEDERPRDVQPLGECVLGRRLLRHGAVTVSCEP